MRSFRKKIRGARGQEGGDAMNAHQRRKARRAKDRESWVMFVPTDPNIDAMRLLKGMHELARVIAGVPLIRGEIGTIER